MEHTHVAKRVRALGRTGPRRLILRGLGCGGLGLVAARQLTEKTAAGSSPVRCDAAHPCAEVGFRCCALDNETDEGICIAATEICPTRTIESAAPPEPGEFELAPGQIGRELAGGLVAAPPAAPAYLALLRVINAPGSAMTAPAEDPGNALILVESGTATVRIEGPVTVTRASGPEEVAAGTEFTLVAGESFLWPGNVTGEFRNDGQEPALTLVAYLAPVEREMAAPEAGEMAATPAA